MRLTLVNAMVATGAATLLADAIWAASQPGDGLEHVSVKSSGLDVIIGIFTKPSSPETAVRDLMKRACEMSPILLAWNVIDARRFPFPDFASEDRL